MPGLSFLCRRVTGLASLFVLLGSLLVAVGAAQADPVLERISFAPRADGAGFVVRIHTNEPLHAYSAPRFLSDDQFELILFNTILSASCQRDAPGGPVQAYTVESRQGHLFLRFQLAANVHVQAAAYRDQTSDDMLVGLTVQAGGPPVRTASTRPSGRSGRAANAPSSNDARERWKLDTVVIDAGHGGHDTGAIGARGLREKDVVLPVALQVGRYLETYLGLNVVYTRQDDRFITLRNRGKIANQAGAKLFISIHANAARNRQATGTETFFLGLHKSDAARKVMERENSVIQYEPDPDVYKALDEQALIEQALAQSAYMRSSEHLAGLIQDQFEHRVDRINRGVKQAGFYVLWGASMPSILVELGFVTNPGEAAFLESETGQDYLASAIFRAVRDFKAQYEKGLDLVIRP